MSERSLRPALTGPLAVLVIGIVVALAMVFFYKWLTRPSPDLLESLSETQQEATKPLGSDAEYQAVFLTNGQVYFGQLDDRGNEAFVKLRNVYYLNTQKAAGGDPSAQAQVSLVRLGSEAHGPLNEMQINREHILFIEDLRGDSQVVTAIKQQNL